MGAECYFLGHSKEIIKGHKAWGEGSVLVLCWLLFFFWIMEIHVEARVCHCRTML